MSKTKLMLDLVQDIRSVAESLEAIVKAIADDDSSTSEVSAVSEPAATAQPASAATLATKASEPTLDLVTLRSFVADKAKTKEQKIQIRALLNKYGCAKVTELPPDQYATFKEEVEALA